MFHQNSHTGGRTTQRDNNVRCTVPPGCKHTLAAEKHTQQPAVRRATAPAHHPRGRPLISTARLDQILRALLSSCCAIIKLRYSLSVRAARAAVNRDQRQKRRERVLCIMRPPGTLCACEQRRDSALAASIIRERARAPCDKQPESKVPRL
jgi:hypothetical protein